MKKLALSSIQEIEGGSDWVTGACHVIGVSRGAGFVGKRVAVLAGKTIIKTLAGGPIGIALGWATIGCVGYGIYKNLSN
ncbi:MAG: hypothetical protein Sapg2KO_32350 [Saprospiraceae bacterium]